MSNLSKLYKETIIKDLMKEFNYKTVMQVPKLEKIVINMGVGEGARDEKYRFRSDHWTKIRCYKSS